MSSAKQKDELSRPSVWHRQTLHLCAHKGGNCNNGADCSPSSSLQSRFRILWLPHFWSAEGHTLKTPFCGRRRAETQRASGVPTLQQRTICDRHRASHARMEIKKVKTKKTLCKNKLNFLNCLPIIYANSTVIFIIVPETKIEGITSLPPLIIHLAVVTSFHIFSLQYSHLQSP